MSDYGDFVELLEEVVSQIEEFAQPCIRLRRKINSSLRDVGDGKKECTDKCCGDEKKKRDVICGMNNGRTAKQACCSAGVSPKKFLEWCGDDAWFRNNISLIASRVSCGDRVHFLDNLLQFVADSGLKCTGKFCGCGSTSETSRSPRGCMDYKKDCKDQITVSSGTESSSVSVVGDVGDSGCFTIFVSANPVQD